jgi:hypothetical protein
MVALDEWFAADLSSVQWLSNGAPETTIHFCRESRTPPRSSERNCDRIADMGEVHEKAM